LAATRRHPHPRRGVRYSYRSRRWLTQRAPSAQRSNAVCNGEGFHCLAQAGPARPQCATKVAKAKKSIFLHMPQFTIGVVTVKALKPETACFFGPAPDQRRGVEARRIGPATITTEPAFRRRRRRIAILYTVSGISHVNAASKLWPYRALKRSCRGFAEAWRI